MANSLYPSFFRIFYHSDVGLHVMTVATKQWNAPSTGHDVGVFDDWTSTSVDADDMIQGLVDVLKVFMPSQVAFDTYIIFNYTSPTGLALPVATGPINVTGTDTGGAWYKAVEQTYSWRTSLFGIFKIVLLDAQSGGDFSKANDPAASANLTNLHNYIIYDGNAFAGRDNGQPSAFISFTKTLNEKLRRAYRLS